MRAVALLVLLAGCADDVAPIEARAPDAMGTVDAGDASPTVDAGQDAPVCDPPCVRPSPWTCVCEDAEVSEAGAAEASPDVGPDASSCAASPMYDDACTSWGHPSTHAWICPPGATSPYAGCELGEIANPRWYYCCP